MEDMSAMEAERPQRESSSEKGKQIQGPIVIMLQTALKEVSYLPVMNINNLAVFIIDILSIKRCRYLLC